MESPLEKAKQRDSGMTDHRVAWARRGDVVWENCFSRIEALEAAIIELTDALESGNPRGRVTKLLGKLGISKKN